MPPPAHKTLPTHDAREQSQKLIDFLYRMAKLQDASIIKPRTYRKIARKEYLKVAQKKHKTKVEIRSALRKQLSYVNRNIKHIHRLLKHLKK
jgi:transposase, IS5 family